MKHRCRNACVYDKCLVTILLWNFMAYEKIYGNVGHLHPPIIILKYLYIFLYFDSMASCMK